MKWSSRLHPTFDPLEEYANETPPADVSIVIGTFGDLDVWEGKSEEAKISSYMQSVPPAQVIHVHGETLADSRNQGAELAETEWIIFLDADDELDVGYIEAMFDAEGDIRRPSTLGVVNGVDDAFEVMIPKKPLLEGNYIIIGAMVRREMIVKVGGFDEYEMSEDWAFWLKCVLEGATISEVPKAIYRVNVAVDGRNSNSVLGDRVYNEIKGRFVKEAHHKGMSRGTDLL